MCFLFNRTTLQVFVTYLTGALYVHPLWFYKHQHVMLIKIQQDATVCRYLFTAKFKYQYDNRILTFLLTVHLSIFISVFNQLDTQNLFDNKFYFMPLHVSSTCAHHQEVKIALRSLWYHQTYRWPSGARDGHIKLIVKQILFIKLVKYWDKR